MGNGASKFEINCISRLSRSAHVCGRGQGYRAAKMNGCLAGVLVVIGLFAAIVPGLIILFWIFHKQNQYEIEMKAIVVKWVNAGRPSQVWR